MKLRAASTLLVVLLASLSGCRRSYAVNVRIPVQSQAALDVTGVWRSSWSGPRSVNVAVLTLQQAGEAVTGSYVTTDAPPGSVQARLAGNELTGFWVEPSGRGGRFRFVFSPDGSRFEGTWGREELDDDGGTWHGER